MSVFRKNKQKVIFLRRLFNIQTQIWMISKIDLYQQWSFLNINTNDLICRERNNKNIFLSIVINIGKVSIKDRKVMTKRKVAMDLKLTRRCAFVNCNVALFCCAEQVILASYWMRNFMCLVSLKLIKFYVLYRCFHSWQFTY